MVSTGVRACFAPRDGGSGPPPGASARVLVHVLTRLILGGPSRPVLALLDRLGRHGFRPVLALGSPGPHEAEARALLGDYPGLELVEVPDLVREPAPRRDLAAALALRRLLRARRPALVHTHTAKAGALGRIAARWTRARAVHTFHGHSMDRAAAGRAAPAWRALERGLARWSSDAIVAVSPSQRDDIALRLGCAPALLAVAPLPFDAGPAPFDEQLRREFGERLRAGGDRVLVFVGRGVPVKGLAHLARAHARLAARSRATAERLRVALVGPLEPRVARDVRAVLAGAGLGERWSFWGPVARPLAAIEAADALVLPSLSEGTPLSVLEALWLGVPVIASAVGGVPDLLLADWSRHGAGEWTLRARAPRGLLLPAADADAWAAALGEFVERPGSLPGDPDERRRFVREVFDADARAGDIVEIYARLGVTP